jgi:hypothetical protein
MDQESTSGPSDLPSRAPTGLVTWSRANAPLPHSFRDLMEECPRNWEVRRISQLMPSRQERHWRFLRTLRTCFDRIPAELNMDVLFYRFPSERAYCQRLSQLKPYIGRGESSNCLSTFFVFQPRGCVSNGETPSHSIHESVTLFPSPGTLQIPPVPKLH